MRGPPSWKSGRRSVSIGVAHRIESQIANTEYVLAVSKLLSPGHLTAPDARKAVRSFYVEQPDGTRCWALPPPGGPLAPHGEVARYAWDDSTALALRGDFPGLLAIMVLLREAVAGREFLRSRQFAEDLFTALPYVCREQWVRPDVDLLLQCIEEMMYGHGIRWLLAQIRVDWGAFRAQILTPTPWCGAPAWVRTGCAAEYMQIPTRPVPILEGIEPLQPWVHRSAVGGQRKAARSPRGLGFPSKRVFPEEAG